MPEAEDIAAAKKGDTQALNRLMDKHKRLAFAIAYKLVQNSSDAEDIVQEAFINVFMGIQRFRSASGFSTWLYRIVYNESLKFLKVEARRRETSRQMPAAAAADEEAKEGAGDDDAQLAVALKHLTENEYVVVSLFYLEDKSVQEIKKMTRLSTSNIKVLLHRARTKMGTALTTYKKANNE